MRVITHGPRAAAGLRRVAGHTTLTPHCASGMALVTFSQASTITVPYRPKPWVGWWYRMASQQYSYQPEGMVRRFVKKRLR